MQTSSEHKRLNEVIEQKVCMQIPCHYYPHSAEPAYMRFSLTPELMPVVFNMALIPQCSASRQEAQTWTILVLHPEWRTE